MFTVVETLLFQRQWPLYWSEEERGAFAAFIAQNPDAGDVVPQSGGIRKVRWGRSGSGKSGGVRVIYFSRTAAGQLGQVKNRQSDRATTQGDPPCPRKLNTP